MNDRRFRFVLPVIIVLFCLFAVYAALFRPAYFSNSDELAILLFAQVLLAAIWNYRARFFPLLLAVFLWAGMVLPLSETWTTGRWVVLAVGALVGLIIYARDQRYSFGTFHLVALFCIIAAMLSAAVSAYPSLAFLKGTSLLLLFLYGSTGARLAALDRTAVFFPSLLMGSELLVYVSAISYFLLRS